ncbi:hypothetical protein MLD38_032845 [Melastoma candidum]|uniref:Uncharacterized protein n=1 Tax=Melastoma candidum TaxID=119954 RepID=A0ACB9M5G0_9MYRT|nr:hypothetical protein MLD38_032845 [Melastoma candidum]
MAYEVVFARSFSRYDQRRLGYGAVVACLLVGLSSFTVLSPYLGPLPILNLRLSMGIGHKSFLKQEAESFPDQVDIEKENVPMEAEVVEVSVEYRSDDVGVAENATYIQEVVQNSTAIQGESITKQPERSGDTMNRQSDSRRIANRSEDDVKINREPLCNVTGSRSDFCEVPTAVVIHPNRSTVFVPSPGVGSSVEVGNNSWRIRPYARKGDPWAMSGVREWYVTRSIGQGGVPLCTRNHSVPAVMFSVGGFSGNHFHSFSDIILPLFLTSRKFKGEVQFVVTNYRYWWTVKFRKMLEKLSKYPIIDIDSNRDVHCYPSAIIGLKRHPKQQLSLDPSEPPHYTTNEFREFLRSAYSLKRRVAAKLSDGNSGGRRPRLLILSRKRSRSFTNIGGIQRLAKRTGFDPVVAEADMDVARFAEIMNSCDAVMGVHGAGLTNVLFLPDNGVLIQVVPYGGVEWVSRTYFGTPAGAMGIKYLEYGISLQESTLLDQFSGDDVVIRDPIGFHKHNWEVFKSVYLDKQNVKLDVRRFRPTMQRAFQLLQ